METYEAYKLSFLGLHIVYSDMYIVYSFMYIYCVIHGSICNILHLLQDDQGMVINVLESICYRLPASIDQPCERFVDRYTIQY